ncbi:hypothetical protein ACOME3_008964 [Neoechinorhynchus agilis]
MFLLLVDATSKWPEIWNLGSRATTGCVIAKLKDCFARFGIPKQIVSVSPSDQWVVRTNRKIERRTGPVSYRVVDENGKEQRIHVDYLRCRWGKETSNAELDETKFAMLKPENRMDGSKSTETDEEEKSSRNEGDSAKEEKPVSEKEASEAVDDRAKQTKLVQKGTREATPEMHKNKTTSTTFQI